MNAKNKKLTNLLAQAILDINLAGADVLEIIDRLNCDMRDVAAPLESVLPPRTYEEPWAAPELQTMRHFFDGGRMHPIPMGYRLRVAFLTNKSWCGTYNTLTQEPNYHAVENASGAEYVDVFLEKIAPVEFTTKAATEFHDVLKDSYMLKTMNSFGQDTDARCEYMRFTITHAEFRKDQEMDS